MIRSFVHITLALTAVVLWGPPLAVAQTSTKNLAVGGGTGMTGSLGGSVRAQRLPRSSRGGTTAGALFITDLDLDLDGSGVVPNGGLKKPAASTPMGISNNSIHITIPVHVSASVSGEFKTGTGKAVSIPNMIHQAIFGRRPIASRCDDQSGVPRSLHRLHSPR